MSDIGFTHLALQCSDAKATIAFWSDYADLHVIHDRTDTTGRTFWLSDLYRAFAIVFIERRSKVIPLAPLAHLGVSLASRSLVDKRLEEATKNGFAVDGPHDSEPPVGYWGFIEGPDGHTLELSFGQEVHLTVTNSRRGVPLHHPADGPPPRSGEDS